MGCRHQPAGCPAFCKSVCAGAGSAAAGEQGRHLYVLGDGCPHCAEAKPYLEGLAERYPWVELRFYEVWYNEENRALFEKMASAYGFEARYVPTIFIGAQHWVGYNKSINPEIEKVIADCHQFGCPDAGAGVIFPAQPTPAATLPAPAPQEQSSTLTLPLIGTVDLSRQSLAVSTALIAFVDGFNPARCGC